MNERSHIEINLDHYDYNIHELKRFLLKDKAFMQIVKADAYGHGAVEIAAEAEKLGASMLGVANSEEGKVLRLHGIQIPVLILSPSLPEEIPEIFEYNLEPIVCSESFAGILNTMAEEKKRRISVHINIDTGMERSGVRYDHALNFISSISKLKGLTIDGIFTHYVASESDPDFSLYQLDRFKKILKSMHISPDWIHIANSSALVTIPDNISNLARIGLLSYGIYSHESLCGKIDLRPVMTFKSRISYISNAKKGESVGYNRTYFAQRDILYAIIPVGYADGYDYLLSNKGKVLINGKVCPVIGKVSMDMTAVDVTELDSVNTGDEVILFGDENPEIRIETLCKSFGGSAYEMLCQTGRRAKRFYMRGSDIVKAVPLSRREFVSSDYDSKELSRVIESAIREKTGNMDVARMIFTNVLERLFREDSRPLFHRHHFYHRLTFSKPQDPVLAKDYYRIDTELSFRKQLIREYFIIACASNEEMLERYFRREDVEYRWLLDGSLTLDEQSFFINSVRINNLELNHTSQVVNHCLEVLCHHDSLKKWTGEQVQFTINTRTYYPRSSHQLTVFVTGMTKGAEICVDYDGLIPHMDIVPFFPGGQPEIQHSNGLIIISTPDDAWLLPGSGVVFAF